MQDEIWHQFGIQNYNGNVLSVYSVVNITGNITEAGKGRGGVPVYPTLALVTINTARQSYNIPPNNPVHYAFEIQLKIVIIRIFQKFLQR